MPELPEVETVKRGLQTLIVGKTIKSIEVLWPSIIVNDVNEFKSQLLEQTVLKVDRRGKYLLIRFSNDLTVVSHLRMEGKYELVANQQIPLSKHAHVLWSFYDGSQLRYLDVRKFGRMQLIKTGTENQVTGLKSLGPEPLGESFETQAFYQALLRDKKSIKQVLLQQHVVTGLGNIYVDEVLWLSQINPQLPANQLTLKQATILHDNIILELQTAVDNGGTTFSTFLNAAGHAGAFQAFLKVYGKKGEPCPRCQTPIKKIKLAQRGTHYCPKCQQLPKVNQSDKPFIIGLTGGIASGKSTVANYFKEAEITVIDADHVAHDLLAKNQVIQKKLQQTFGTEVMANDGIDRKRLGQIVFSDSEKLAQLNQIMAPIIKQELLKQIDKQQTQKLIVLDIPLLFEQGYEKICDQVVVVYVNQKTQITRLMKRNALTQKQAKQRIDSQMPLLKKRQKADYVLNNNGDLTQLKAAFDDLLNDLKKIH